MSFTNIELVRKHLQESIRVSGEVENYLLKLSGTETVRLPNAGLVDDSEIIKGKTQVTPHRESFVLADVAHSLTRSELTPESVVLAKDDSLSEIYAENIDYTVDYSDGKITRIATGAIESGQSVTAWYGAFTVYTRQTDYQVSYRDGELTRIESGSIGDGQLLWIDYRIESSVFSDDAIFNAIVEASAQLDCQIDQAIAGDASSILTVAETYLTVSLLAQIRALEVLQSSSLADRSRISASLLEISNRYRESFAELIKPYRSRKPTLAGPVRS